MPRVKRGVMVKKRHNKIIKQAKGYFSSRKNVFQTANEAVAKAGNYAYRDRRVKKRDFRRLWIARIGAACRNGGTRYSVFIHALGQAGIDLDRKVLADMVINDPAAFTALLKQVGVAG
ncbi:50S ribosomal protein L20 [Armatimonas rosea]|uniref:Large ribosomal subunit protein bL20 n=1 Tax=Armatimonas rosea TaxID=685828 RepID=A0A7W9SUI5_ARMRO|nr:50S ribosomal protein L20 [Armatimonas rosea]MBB6053082.1 large subunit ribosomal protein L20 [Armatimonas rosea]